MVETYQHNQCTECKCMDGEEQCQKTCTLTCSDDEMLSLYSDDPFKCCDCQPKVGTTPTSVPPTTTPIRTTTPCTPGRICQILLSKMGSVW